MPKPKSKTPRHSRIDPERLHAMIEEATVDCSNESEQATGWFTMIEDNVAVPFETTVLGLRVTVERIDLTGRDQLVALCKRGPDRQRLDLLDLPLPDPRPAGAEWIEAYRHWAGKR